MWNLLDTCAKPAAENIALDDALLKARGKDLIPNTLRFLQFKPRCVLVGYHQSVEQEVREDFCRENDIDVNRRITGGGAIFFDESQIGWEIIASKSSFPIPLEKLYEKLCDGVIIGLKNLEIDAKFRPKNDIEVNGRKISGTGGTEHGGAFLFQGTLLVDFDVDTMLRSLRIPIKKLKDKEIESLKERVTCLKWELDKLPDADEIKNRLGEGFERAFDIKFDTLDYDLENLNLNTERFKSHEWIYSKRRVKKDLLRSVSKTPGGLIRVSVGIRNGRINDVMITGDFFAYPKRTIFDLEAVLKNTIADIENVRNIIYNFFSEYKTEIPGVSAEDFVNAVTCAIEKMDYHRFGVSPGEANHVFTVNGHFEDIIKNCEVFLLPYCAKLPECTYRQRQGCVMCGKCTIGDAYRIAEELGVETISITNYEHLMKILTDCKKRGIKGYLGSCCEAFYIKHQNDLERVGLSGVLIDIDNTTCYDLGKEEEAYLGKFESHTDLKLDLFKKVVKYMYKT